MLGHRLLIGAVAVLWTCTAWVAPGRVAGRRRRRSSGVIAGAGAAAVADRQSPVLKRRVGREMVAIGGPALVGLIIEPAASLVDTAFVGRCAGPAALAGVGVGSAIFNVLARSFNFLQSATTTQVAAVRRSKTLDRGQFDAPMARRACAALYVAAGLGVVVALGLATAAPWLVALVGGGDGDARTYLRLRALGAPGTLALMALQGSFRGARDATTPLFALTAATLANVALDALAVPTFGAGGAAAATAASQLLAAAILVATLSRRLKEGDGTTTPLDVPSFLPRVPRRDLAFVATSGSILTLRTVSTVFVLQYASVLASRVGAAAGAAHVVCFQVWYAAVILSDAIAAAAQALLAEAIGSRDADQARAVVKRAAAAALVFGAMNAAFLVAGRDRILTLFTRDVATLAAAAAIWPRVVRSQLWATAAFVLDGFLFGASDFTFCVLSMMVAAAAALRAQLTTSLPASSSYETAYYYLSSDLLSTGGGEEEDDDEEEENKKEKEDAPIYRPSLGGVWLGIELLMGLRIIMGVSRIASASGPWRTALRRR